MKRNRFEHDYNVNLSKVAFKEATGNYGYKYKVSAKETPKGGYIVWYPSRTVNGNQTEEEFHLVYNNSVSHWLCDLSCLEG